MLILPNPDSTGVTRPDWRPLAVWGASALFLVALAAWSFVWWQSRAADLPRVQAVSSASLVHPDLASLGAADIQPDAVLGFLASAAKDMGLVWVAVQVGDAPRAKESQHLDVWQAQISLQGSYPAVKRWLREAVGRYPNLVLQNARWARAGGALPTATGGADALEAQVQLTWLRRPVGRRAEPAPVAASGQGSQ